MFNPFKLISDGLLASLPLIVSVVDPSASDFVTDIKNEIAAGTATKDSIKKDIRDGFKAIEAFTNDAWDAVLESFDKVIEDAFATEALVEVALHPAPTDTPTA